MLINDLSREVVEKSAMEAVLQGELDANKLREKSLDYWEHTATEQYIDKYFSGDTLTQVPIFTSGLTRQVCLARSLVFKKAPHYRCDPKYLQYTKGLWPKMNLLEQLTFLLGTVGLLTTWDASKQQLRHDLLNFFEPIFLPGEKEPFGVVYQTETQGASRSKSQNHRYVLWTEGRDSDPGLHFSFDRDGNIYAPHNNPQMINPYQDIIPVTWAHRNPPVRDWGNGSDGSDIVEANQQLDLALTELALGLRFGAVGIRYATGVDSDELVAVSPDKMLMLPEGASLGSVGPTTSLIDLIEAAKWMVSQALHNNSLRIKWADEKGNSPSGESLRVQEISTLEAREQMAEMVWRPFEQQRFEVDKRVLENRAGISITDEFSVDYVEPDIYYSPQEKREEWKFRWENGLATKKDWFKSTFGEDFPDDEIEKIMAEAKVESGEVEEPENPLLSQLASPVSG